MLCRHTSDVLLRFPEASLLEEIPFQGLFSDAKASLLREISRQRLFSRGGYIPAQRNPPSGIIFPRRKHPCSEKSTARDYFPKAKASLLRKISRQRLFSRGGCIPAQRIPPSGIIFPRRKHPCSKKSTARDYFPEADASLLREFPFQGLFSRDESIPAQRNLPSGIIFPRRKHPAQKNLPSGIIFPRRMHPCSENSPFRDYFPEADASLLREISRQGLFSRGKSIPAQRNLPSGIIFPRQMHPCSEKSPFRDYFPEAKASLLGEIPFQGLFSRGGCIPARRNPPSGIIFPRLALCLQSYTDLSRIRRTQANVYQSYLISRRAASFASSAAPEAGTVIPSCTPHYGRNLPVFFAKRG